MSATPVRVAVIGCGRCAQDHIQAYQRLPEARIVAVADTDQRHAESAATQTGAHAFTDYRKLLKEEQPDAVSICTPPATHAEITLQALAAGAHVLCEKPLTITLADAKRVVRAAQERGRVLMMASKFRFVEDIVKAKGIIESGILGRLALFENVFCSRVDMRDRWNSRKALAGGGVLFDNGTHSVDIARFLLGEIITVQAQHGIQVQELEVEDTSRLSFQTRTGVMGTIDVSWSLQKDAENYITLFGTEGTLSIGWRSSKYRQSSHTDWVVFGEGYKKQQAFLGQLGHFVRCAQGEEEPIVTPTDGLESVRVIEAAYRSSAVNKWMELEPLMREAAHGARRRA